MVIDDVRLKSSYGSYGDDTAPTVGVSISPWIIGLVAAVYLIPKLYETHRRTRKEK